MSLAYITDNGLLPEVLVKTDSGLLRDQLFLPAGQGRTQLNQDVFALLVNRFRAGFFVEIGANDGFTLSNTLYLEEQFGWTGLLVEANPEYTTSLRLRTARSTCVAVCDYDGEVQFRSAGLYGGVEAHLDSIHQDRWRSAPSITVPAIRLVRLLREAGVPQVVDFISVDVEGGELPIVRQICETEEFRFRCGCIEYNQRQSDYRTMAALLESVGYRVVWDGQTEHDLLFVDPGL